MGFSGGTSGKEAACQCWRHKRLGFDPWVEKTPWGRARQPTPVFLPGESHGQRSLVGYSPEGGKEFDTTEMTLAHSPIKVHPKNLTFWIQLGFSFLFFQIAYGSKHKLRWPCSHPPASLSDMRWREARWGWGSPKPLSDHPAPRVSLWPWFKLP